jgi:hypothetical protein
MIAADTKSEAAKIFMVMSSDAMFKMLVGEHSRIERHCKSLGMLPDRIHKLRRKYWRRRARYHCPEPEVMIRGLYDIYCFARTLNDPLRPGCAFLVPDHEDVFRKEIKYIQAGLLSDPPGVNMYVCIVRSKKTGLLSFRCLRTSSPLEGYHLHLRAARHPGMCPAHH